MDIDAADVDAAYDEGAEGPTAEELEVRAAELAAERVAAAEAAEADAVHAAAQAALVEARTKAAEEAAAGAFTIQPSLFLADMVKTLEAQAQAMPWMFDSGGGGDGQGAAESGVANGVSARLAAQRSKYEAQMQRESQRLSDVRARKQSSPAYKKMLAQRETLPCYMMKEHIAEVIRTNQIVVLSGETGCGKTTQLPQIVRPIFLRAPPAFCASCVSFVACAHARHPLSLSAGGIPYSQVLDDLIDRGKGASCNMICTQPRRISAISVAERVADERAEKVGRTVGYSIRLESKTCRDTRLLFCTTGVLLRRLQCDSELGGVSHIFVDEIHERDLNSDFLLIILKGLLPSRPNLKLILMSATLNADLFAEYFNGAPIISVPGRTFPVEAFYLEDVLELTGHAIVPGSDCAARPQRGGARPSRRKKGGDGDGSKLNECDDDPTLGQPLPVASLVARYAEAGYSQRTMDSLSIVDENVINYELLHELLIAIDASIEEGAILVFMPGMREITTIYEILLGDRCVFFLLTLPPICARRSPR